MHAMDTAVFDSLHSKKGSTCLPGKKIGKYCRVFVSPLPFVLLLFCLLKELRCVCDPLNPCRKKFGFTYILHIRRYGKMCTYCHMLYILLHPWCVVLWQLDCQRAYVHISFAWCFLLLEGYPNTVYVMTVPCPLIELVIIVHPVNRILCYFVDACLILFFMHLLVYFPHDSWGCSQMCEL